MGLLYAVPPIHNIFLSTTVAGSSRLVHDFNIDFKRNLENVSPDAVMYITAQYILNIIIHVYTYRKQSSAIVCNCKTFAKF